MDVKLINPFIDSTLRVLGTMARLENMDAGKPHLKNGPESYGEITGLIGVAGETARGSFAVSFEIDCITEIAARMLGEELEDIEDQDLPDAVGEITNMICGGALAELAKLGHKFDNALPTVVTGKGHKIRHVTQYPIISVSFNTEVGQFFVEACIAANNDK